MKLKQKSNNKTTEFFFGLNRQKKEFCFLSIKLVLHFELKVYTRFLIKTLFMFFPRKFILTIFSTKKHPIYTNQLSYQVFTIIKSDNILFESLVILKIHLNGD
jgi:hypothetical protein